MSKIKCYNLKLESDIDKDMHLDSIRYEILDFQLTFTDTVRYVKEYFNKKGISLNSVDDIYLEGDIVSPIFTGGPTTSVKKDVMPLAISIIAYDKTKGIYTISPIGRENISKKVIENKLKPYIVFYLPLSSIYPFTIVRFFKILYANNKDTLLKLLKEVYSNNKQDEEIKDVIDNTGNMLKIPKKPTIQCSSNLSEEYYVVYRCQRSFASAIIDPKTINYLCESSKGLIIDHHIVFLKIKNKEAAFYYTTILNYMFYKVINEKLGLLIRNQFGRPLKALIEADLEWRNENWQYNVANRSEELVKISRKYVLKQLSLNENLDIMKIIDGKEDCSIKQHNEKVVNVSQILFNLHEWKEIVEEIDKNIDKKKLLESLINWVVEIKKNTINYL